MARRFVAQFPTRRGGEKPGACSQFFLACPFSLLDVQKHRALLLHQSHVKKNGRQELALFVPFFSARR